jgi:SurA-like N-terminal domain
MRISVVLSVLALIVAGCGGGDEKKPSSTAPDHSVPADAVAKVGDTPVAKSLYDHWSAIGAKQGTKGTELRDQTMQFLLSSEWLIQEAPKHGVSMTDAEVQKSFDQQRKSSYPHDADYQAFLEKSGQSEDDLLYRTKVQLLADKLREDVTAGVTKPADQQKTLDAFVKDFQARYREITFCAEDYVVDQCANGTGSPTTPLPGTTTSGG